MPLPITQKFSSPTEQEGKFSAQLERYSQQVSIAINSCVSYDYVAAERTTGSNYLFLDRALPVYVQTIQLTVQATTFSQQLSIQSPNQGIVFLSCYGAIAVSGTTYPVPFYSPSNNFFFNISASGNISFNATSLFVGGVLTLSVFYVYTN